MSEVDFALLSGAGPLVAILDQDDRIVLWNHACSETTGYTFDQVRGRRAWELLSSPEEIEPLKQGLAELKAGGHPTQRDSTLVTKSGDRRWVAWSAYLTRTPDGTPQFVFMVGVDRTRARRAASLGGEVRTDRLHRLGCDHLR